MNENGVYIAEIGLENRLLLKGIWIIWFWHK